MKANQLVATGIMALFLVTGSVNTFAGQSGAIAQGNISVYKGGQLADKFTGQNPVEDEAMLVCDGKCMIKATGVSLIGSDGARLAIKKDADMFNLMVNQGRVEFVVTDSISKMAFYTPDGQYTVADIMFNAGTNIPVRGYMQVNANGAAEIGVYEGRMVLNTATGAKTIDSNNLIQLAQVDVPAPPPMATDDQNDDSMTPLLFAGGAVALGVLVATTAGSSDDAPYVPPISNSAPPSASPSN